MDFIDLKKNIKIANYKCHLCFDKCCLCKVSYRVGGGGWFWLNIRNGLVEPFNIWLFVLQMPIVIEIYQLG